MPAIIGIIADRWIQAQKVLAISHLISGAAMICAGFYGLGTGDAVQFGPLFTLYTIGVAFYMPTIALSYSVAYYALEEAGLDRVKTFPADSRVRHHRFHHLHVVCRSAGFPADGIAVRDERWHRDCVGPLCVHIACVQ